MKMQNGQAKVAFTDGRFDLAIPAGVESPAAEVRSARIGLQDGDGTCSFSTEWETLESAPLTAADRWGSYSGLRVVLASGNDLQVEWCAVIYERRPLAALWMKVRNVGRQDQRLLRLFVLHADPGTGSAVTPELDPARGPRPQQSTVDAHT